MEEGPTEREEIFVTEAPGPPPLPPAGFVDVPVLPKIPARVKSSQVKWGRHERNEGTTGRARPARALKEIRAQRQVSEVKRFQTVVISFTVSRGLAPRASRPFPTSHTAIR